MQKLISSQTLSAQLGYTSERLGSFCTISESGSCAANFAIRLASETVAMSSREHLYVAMNEEWKC